MLRVCRKVLAPPPLPGQTKKRKHSLVVWERLKYQISLPVTPGHGRHWETKAVMPIERPVDLKKYGNEGFTLKNAQIYDVLADPVVRAPEEYPPELFELGEWSALSYNVPESAMNLPFQTLGMSDVSHSDATTALEKAQHLQLWQELYLDGPFMGEAKQVMPSSNVEELFGRDGNDEQMYRPFMQHAYVAPLTKI